MKGTKWRGINAEKNAGRNLTIRRNNFNSTNDKSYGIYAKDYTNGNLIVAQNNFNNTNNAPITSNLSGQNGIARMGTAVYVASTLLNPLETTTTRIDSNKVNNFKYGIHVLNGKTPEIKLNTVLVNYTNTLITSQAIASGGTPSTFWIPVRKGIKCIIAQNSPKVKIWRNELGRTLPESLSSISVEQLQGIRQESSANADVWKNRMIFLSAGYYAFGSNQASDVDCNTMLFNKNGFYLNASDIGQQGNPVTPGTFPTGVSASNEWYFTSGFRVDGIQMATPVPNPYYHKPAPFPLLVNPYTSVSYNPILGGGTGTQWSDNIVYTTAQSRCGASAALAPIVLGTPAQQRNQAMAKLVQNQLNYGALDMGMKHYYHNSVYRQLLENQSLMTLGTDIDTAYSNYFAQHQIGSATKLMYEVNTALASGDLATATVANNALDAACTIFGNNKTINTMLINCLANNTVLSASDSSVLATIACMDPIVHGSAVYQARAILDVDGGCETANHNMLLTSESEDEAPIQNTVDPTILLYPNPNSGNFTLTSEVDIKEIHIFDVTGKKVFSTKSIEGNIIGLKTNLHKGLYVLHVFTTTGVIKVMKIEIL